MTYIEPGDLLESFYSLGGYEFVFPLEQDKAFKKFD